MVGQLVHGVDPHVARAVHPAELAQVEEQGELPGHLPERPERGQDLGEQEGQVKGVYGPLQGEDDGFFICHEEQEHRQLNGE